MATYQERSFRRLRILRVSDHWEVANPTPGVQGKVAPIGEAAQVSPVAYAL